MRHVDEGTIHAWLDAEVTDPAEAAWIEEHLRWCAACSARLAEERSTYEQAHALLAVTAPAGEPPAFQEILTQAERTSRKDAPSRSFARFTQDRRWLLQAGWAASLALAVGIGWAARELADREATQSEAAAVVFERADSTAPDPAGNAEAPPPAPGEVRTTTSQPVLVNPDKVERASPPQAGAQAKVAEALRSRSEQAAAAPPPAAAEPPAAAAPASPPQLDALAGAANAGPRQALAPPPAQLGRVAAELRQERVAVTGAAPAAAFATVQVPEWRTMPRTEAAVRSGMALYGLDGLEPALTAISADGRIVLTRYRLESGATVELKQERATLQAAPTVVSVEATRRANTSRGGAAGAADVAAGPRLWFDVRGDVRVSLQTTSDATDLNALGAKLRIE
jgi:hypothetical protein